MFRRESEDKDDGNVGLVVDAQTEDDASIFSSSTNSVAMLVKGGPSYRDANMFRRESKDKEDDNEGLVADAQTDDDASIFSSSTNSVAMLVKGGPSYRDVNMFRRESDDLNMFRRVSEDETKRVSNESLDKKKKGSAHGPGKKGHVKKIPVVTSSFISSLGSKSTPGDSIKEIPSDEEAKVSPTSSDLGELPSLPPMSHSRRSSLGSHGLSQSARTSRSSTNHQRASTVGIIKSSSSTSTAPSRAGRYKRSVSWGHMVFSKEEVKASVSAAMARQDSISSGFSVISFPHLNRAAPLRSDSIGSTASIFSFPPPLRMGAPLRSESIGSMASIMSPYALSHAHPVHSPRHSFFGTHSTTPTAGGPPPFLSQLSRAHSVRSESQMSLATDVGATTTTAGGPPPFLSQLSRAHSVRSESQNTVATATSTTHTAGGPPPFLSQLSRAHSVRSESQNTIVTGVGALEDLLDECSLNSEEYVDANPTLPTGAAWESPLVSKRKKPPLHSRGQSASTAGAADEGKPEHKVFIRTASKNSYEGMGIEIEEVLSPQEVEPIDKARKHRSMVSFSSRSQRSFLNNHSRNNSLAAVPPMMMQSLDDSFIIKNIDFERHSSEILRSLSNEDLYSSHHLETITGGSSKGNKPNELSSIARVFGDQGATDAGSWDLESSNSYNLAGAPANAWGVFEDEYAEGYGAHDTLPFRIFGTSASDKDCHPHVLSPPLMESLQNFFPPTISETNFWLKYSLVRDGASLPSLLRHIRGTKHTLIAIETVEGEVFGSFTSSPWRKNWNYYGNGEAFLWRMRRSRSEKDAQYSVLDQAKLESELDVFYWAGSNDLVQYCTQDMLAVGGGSLRDDAADDIRDDDTDADGQRELPPQSNPAFSKAGEGGFGLAIDSELLRGTSSSCATFQSPPLSRLHADGSPFEILNIEVWTMTPCGNVGDAENLEMKTLFLEAYNSEF